MASVQAMARRLANAGFTVDSRRAQARLKRLAGLAPEIIERRMRRAAEEWCREAAAKAPVRTGRLRARMRWEVKRQGSVVRAVVTAQVPYALWLTAGTRRIAGGRVMHWREGRPTIKRWPAKQAFGKNPAAELPIILPQRAKAVHRLLDGLADELLKG